MSWETLKEKGNQEFKKQNYIGAIEYYNQALSKLILTNNNLYSHYKIRRFSLFK